VLEQTPHHFFLYLATSFNNSHLRLDLPISDSHLRNLPGLLTPGPQVRSFIHTEERRWSPPNRYYRISGTTYGSQRDRLTSPSPSYLFLRRGYNRVRNARSYAQQLNNVFETKHPVSKDLRKRCTIRPKRNHTGTPRIRYQEFRYRAH